MVHTFVNKNTFWSCFGVASSLLFASPFVVASAPTQNPEIQTELRKLLKTPENQKGPVRLTLKQVTLAAIKNSDSFRATVAAAASISSARLRVSELTDTRLTVGAQQEWNRNQPNSPFGTIRFDQFSADVQLAKRFATGTQVALGLTEVRNDSTFGGTFGAFGVRGSAARVTLSQSLWRDFFGQSTRDALEAGSLQSKIERAQVEAAIEDWFIQLAGIYHQAWFAQQQIDGTSDNVKRRELLAQLFRRRQALGTSEESDRLQIEAALESNRIQKVEYERALERTWHLLITTLKLPDDYRRFRPVEIPLEIRDPESYSKLGCEKTPEQSRATTVAQNQLAAAEKQLESSGDQLRPELNLNLGLVTNATVLNQPDRLGNRWIDTFTAKNPAWTVGLSLSVPLDGSAAKADALQALTRALQADAQVRIQSDQLKVNFEALCADLKVAERHLQLYQQLETNLKRRMQLEELRYRQARSQPFNVLQAGDEWYGTSIAWAQSKTQWWDKRFQLEKVRGTLFAELNSWVEQETGQTLSQLLDSLESGDVKHIQRNLP